MDSKYHITLFKMNSRMLLIREKQNIPNAGNHLYDCRLSRLLVILTSLSVNLVHCRNNNFGIMYSICISLYFR